MRSPAGLARYSRSAPTIALAKIAPMIGQNKSASSSSNYLVLMMAPVRQRIRNATQRDGNEVVTNLQRALAAAVATRIIATVFFANLRIMSKRRCRNKRLETGRLTEDNRRRQVSSRPGLTQHSLGLLLLCTTAEDDKSFHNFANCCRLMLLNHRK